MYRSRYLSAAIILAVSLAIIGLLSSFTPYLEVLELKSYDFMMATIRGPLEPPSDIAIVAIDEDSLSEFSSTLKLNWPWPRSVHGELIAILNEAGAKVGFATLNRSSRDPVIRQARLSVAGEPTLVTQTLNQLDLELDLSRIPVASYEGNDPQVLINYAGGARPAGVDPYSQLLPGNRL